MSSLVVDILKRIAALDDASKQKLLLQMKALKVTSAPPIADMEDASFALKCVCDALQEIGTETFGYERLRRSAGYRAFNDKVPAVLSFVRNASPKRIVQRRIIMFGLRQLTKEFTRGGYTVTGVTMMAHFHRVPSFINRAFPGYARSGYLGQIFSEGNEHVRKEPNIK